eukprot:3941081-Rhodomonas_salina.2
MALHRAYALGTLDSGPGTWHLTSRPCSYPPRRSSAIDAAKPNTSGYNASTLCTGMRLIGVFVSWYRTRGTGCAYRAMPASTRAPCAG